MTSKLEDIGLLPGDILLCTDNSWVARGIKFFQNLHTDESWASHAALVMDHNTVLEATFKGSKINPLSKYDNPKYSVRIYRIPLDGQQRLNLHVKSMNKVGKPYPYLKIALFAMDGIATRVARVFGRDKPVFFFSERFGVFNIPVCSQLVVYCIHKFAEYIFSDRFGHNVAWRKVSPDYLEDLLGLEINGGELVYKRG